MRCALVSDIHGNEVALDAVLRAVAKDKVDLVVSLGDVATLGPRPCEVVDMLEATGYCAILGNHDEFLIDPQAVHRYTDVPAIVAAIDWSRDRLGPQRLAQFCRFQRTLVLEDVPELLLFHGSPSDNTCDLLAEHPLEEIEARLGPRRVPVMIGGHTHIQMLRRLPTTLLVNPGSVGMPFRGYVGGGVPELLDHAEYAIVDIEGGEVRASLCRAPLPRAQLRQVNAATPDNPLSHFFVEQYR